MRRTIGSKDVYNQALSGHTREQDEFWTTRKREVRYLGKLAL